LDDEFERNKHENVDMHKMDRQERRERTKAQETKITGLA